MRKRRKFYRGAMNHIYQRTLSGNNLFYEYEDFLTFFTMMSVSARSADIKVLSLCLMYNHFHSLAQSENMEELSDFINHVTSWFAREFNLSIGRSGQLLKKNYGSAPKRDEKAIRNTINYIGNNPVEKKTCARAEEYRWNFLAYAQSKFPFSSPIVLRSASRKIRRAVKEIDAMVTLNLPLKFGHIRRLFNGLQHSEIEQLTDYIISEYMFIDFECAASYYGSYSKMIEAIHYNTGSEYEINEEWDCDPDVAYNEMSAYIKQFRPETPVRSVISLSRDEKSDLNRRLQAHTSASARQIAKFLHLPVAGKHMKHK